MSSSAVRRAQTDRPKMVEMICCLGFFSLGGCRLDWREVRWDILDPGQAGEQKGREALWLRDLRSEICQDRNLLVTGRQVRSGQSEVTGRWEGKLGDNNMSSSSLGPEPVRP